MLLPKQEKKENKHRLQTDVYNLQPRNREDSVIRRSRIRQAEIKEEIVKFKEIKENKIIRNKEKSTF